MESKQEKESPSDLELERIFNEDQAERMNAMGCDESTRNKMVSNDRLRRDQVKKLITEKKVITALDHFYAAMILQHSDKAEDILEAKRLAEESYKMGYTKARWLAAAAEDRHLMFNNKPQYLSQYQYDSSEHKWKLWPVDPNISDQQRVEMGMPTLKQAELRVSQFPAFK